MKRILALTLVAVAATSCVTTRQYNSLRAELIASQSRLEHSRGMLNEYADQSDELARKNIQQQTEIAAQRDKLTDLQQRYDRLLDAGEANASEASKRLQEQRKQIDDNTSRLAELEASLAARDKALEDMRKKVADALIGFDGKGLTITKRNGKVYISMDDKLIFRSGSYEIGSRGAEALRDVAAVLAANPDMNIMVEGHTDDVPFRGKSGPIKDNLDLSAMRATAVTRLLLENNNIEPTRIVTAGRGEWLPLTMGTSAEARAKNRRTLDLPNR